MRLPPGAQLPDGADTLSLESVMERLGANTTRLTELTVDYAGVKITGNVYAKLFDEPWLQRLPLISWPEFMDGLDDPAVHGGDVPDVTFGMQGVDVKNGKRDQTLLHALWTDCRGSTECGASRTCARST